MTAAAATQEPGRTNSRHADASLAQAATTATGTQETQIMAPCTLERTETAGGITISQYKVWQQFGGGYNIVARNGSETERIHTRSQRQADETFAMLVGKYGDGDYMEQRQASRDADDLYAWATGR